MSFLYKSFLPRLNQYSSFHLILFKYKEELILFYLIQKINNYAQIKPKYELNLRTLIISG